MAQKPTIYRFNITLADVDRGHYDELRLTVARHPSETLERMLARVLAYCLNAEPGLAFAGGLSVTAEPDLWTKTLTGEVALWIDVGEPSFDRIKKACRSAAVYRIYSFNTKSDDWWRKLNDATAKLPVTVFQVQWPGLQALTALVERTSVLNITVADDAAYVACDLGTCELSWLTLQAPSNNG